jgi:hypothetical protein
MGGMNRPIFGFLWPPDPPDKDHAARQRRLLRIPGRGPLHIAVLVLATIILVMLTATLVLAGMSNWLMLLAIAVLIATFTVLLLRAWAVGTYVNDDGIVVQRMFSADVAPWRDVHELMVGTDGCVSILLLTGQRYRTHIYPRSLDLIGRSEAYDIAVTKVMRWFTQE